MRIKPTALAITATCLLCACGASRPGVYKVDARGDGTTLVTDALQRSIDACNAAGGGIVVVPAGRYVTGTLFLRENVTLRLDEGAVLLGSTDAKDYRNPEPFGTGSGEKDMGYALLAAVDVKNVGVEGPGTIDGRGREVAAVQKVAEGGKYGVRPFLVRILRCEGVKLSGVRLHNSGAWTTHLSQCRDVTVDKVEIHSRGLANNDGIDIDSCSGVRVTNCTIVSDDDSICLKATSPLPCRDVVIEGCTLTSRCAAFKMGTESLGDFENVSVSNCDVRGAGLGGIKILSVDGAVLRNVNVSQIRMDDVRVPIFMRLGARLKTFRPGDAPRPPGRIEGVSIRNVTATRARQIGVMITGLPGQVVENVALENIRIDLPGGGKPEDAAVILDEKPAAYPEVKMFGDVMPAYGLYARHVRGLKVTGLEIKLAQPDGRPATTLIDAADVRGDINP